MPHRAVELITKGSHLLCDNAGREDIATARPTIEHLQYLNMSRPVLDYTSAAKCGFQNELNC